MQEESFNQTQFSLDEQLNERIQTPKTIKTEENPPIVSESVKKDKKVTIKYVILGFGIVVLLISVLLLSVTKKDSTPTKSTESIDPTPLSIPEAAHPLVDRAEMLKNAHDMTDPSDTEITYPPVNFELSLESK